jgi:uncharacterized protein (DUF362 family)/Pyruvate/2-oxoacid:ferredoxin oxidoreductase delta subunit
MPDRATVAVEPCPDYHPERLEAALRRILDSFGGMGEFVSPGQTVLLKVNLLAAKGPDRGITTHPAVVEAVAREVQRAGGRVVLGDSPAGVMKNIRRYWAKTGIGEVAERLGIDLVRFEGTGTRAHRVDGRVYHLTRFVTEVDRVINLPKLKTHGLTLMTGAVKNCYGTIPGFQKSEYHKQAPHPDPFAEIVVDVFSLVSPVLHVMDGILALEGNGPSTSGSPRKVGLLLASPDAVALDAVAASVIGFDPLEIPTTRVAASRGLGVADLSAIELDGPPLERIRIPDYRLPSNYFLRYVPTWMVRTLGRFVWVRPKPVPDRCTACGACIANCPVDAMTPDRRGVPRIDYDRCIHCLSCDESCDHDAIEQAVSWLARRFH